MTRKVATIDIPLMGGVRQDIEKRMFPVGPLSALKNMRQTKDGRWGVRNDYTALGRTTPQGNNLAATDLLSFDDRLFALGDANGTQLGAAGSTATDLYEYPVRTPGTGAQRTRPTGMPASLRRSGCATLVACRR